MLLRTHRQRLGLTQAQLAQRVGKTQAYISSLESGRRTTPGVRTMNALADALALSGDERDGFVLGFVRAAQEPTTDSEHSFRCASVAGEEAA
jgi:transcriptional regulator with XRE-family HTH domain